MGVLDRMPTFVEQERSFEQGVRGVDPTLTRWEAGSNLDAMKVAAVMTTDQTLEFAVDLFRSLFLGTAEASDLDKLILDRFNATRKGPSTAEGHIVITPTEGVAPYTIPAGTTVTGVNRDGITVTATTQEAAISGEGYPIRVQVMVPGPEGNASPNTLTEIQPVLVADPTATVVQADYLSGGSVAETDDALRLRFASFFNTTSKGTSATIEAAAMSVPGVRYVYLEEVTTTAGFSSNVYVADSTGAGNAVLADKAFVEIDKVRAFGTHIAVMPSSIQYLNLTLRLFVMKNIDRGGIRDVVHAAIIAYGEALPPGASLYLSRIGAVAQNAHPHVRGIEAVGLPENLVAPTNPQDSLRLNPAGLTIVFQEVL